MTLSPTPPLFYMAELRVCFRVEISCCIFKRRWHEVERLWKWRQISHFLTPVKIRGGVGELSGQIFGASLRPNHRYTFDGRTLRSCWMPCPCKNEESTAVKLKAVSTNEIWCLLYHISLVSTNVGLPKKRWCNTHTCVSSALRCRLSPPSRQLRVPSSQVQATSFPSLNVCSVSLQIWN